MSPIIIAIPPPRISAGGLPISRPASIRTLTPSPTAFGSKITSTLTKKNYASQGRRGLEYVTGSERVMERSMLLVRQTVALVALLFSLISLVGWMAFLVFAGNEFLERHLLPVLGIGAGG